MNENEVLDLYKEGYSTYQISKILNTYPNKIRRCLIKLGVKLKNKSEAQKNALQKGLAKIPTEGKERTNEEKLKISQGMSKSWKNMDEEKYKYRCEMAKQKWMKLSEKEKERMRQLALKEIHRASREGSKLERFIRDVLVKNNYNVVYHYILDNTQLEVDMYLPSLKTIIEVDGLSHFEPIWGEERFQKQVEADMKKNGLILTKGFVMIRIKHIHDSLTIANRHKIEKLILKLVRDIENDYPKKPERYIEVEL